MLMTSPPAKWLMTYQQGGAIRLVGTSLIVKQAPSIHRAIVAILNMLDESEKATH